MYPACITTLALVTASATSAGGLTALILKKFRARNTADKVPAQIQAKENHHGQ